jgi:hypothetical protein
VGSPADWCLVDAVFLFGNLEPATVGSWDFCLENVWTVAVPLSHSIDAIND